MATAVAHEWGHVMRLQYRASDSDDGTRVAGGRLGQFAGPGWAQRWFEDAALLHTAAIDRLGSGGAAEVGAWLQAAHPAAVLAHPTAVPSLLHGWLADVRAGQGGDLAAVERAHEAGERIIALLHSIRAAVIDSADSTTVSPAVVLRRLCPGPPPGTPAMFRSRGVATGPPRMVMAPHNAALLVAGLAMAAVGVPGSAPCLPAATTALADSTRMIHAAHAVVAAVLGADGVGTGGECGGSGMPRDAAYLTQRLLESLSAATAAGPVDWQAAWAAGLPAAGAGAGKSAMTALWHAAAARLVHCALRPFLASGRVHVLPLTGGGATAAACKPATLLGSVTYPPWSTTDDVPVLPDAGSIVAAMAAVECDAGGVDAVAAEPVAEVGMLGAARLLSPPAVRRCMLAATFDTLAVHAELLDALAAALPAAALHDSADEVLALLDACRHGAAADHRRLAHLRIACRAVQEALQPGPISVGWAKGVEAVLLRALEGEGGGWNAVSAVAAVAGMQPPPAWFPAALARLVPLLIRAPAPGGLEGLLQHLLLHPQAAHRLAAWTVAEQVLGDVHSRWSRYAGCPDVPLTRLLALAATARLVAGADADDAVAALAAAALRLACCAASYATAVEPSLPQCLRTITAVLAADALLAGDASLREAVARVQAAARGCGGGPAERDAAIVQPVVAALARDIFHRDDRRRLHAAHGLSLLCNSDPDSSTASPAALMGRIDAACRGAGAVLGVAGRAMQVAAHAASLPMPRALVTHTWEEVDAALNETLVDGLLGDDDSDDRVSSHAGAETEGDRDDGGEDGGVQALAGGEGGGARHDAAFGILLNEGEDEALRCGAAAQVCAAWQAGIDVKDATWLRVAPMVSQTWAALQRHMRGDCQDLAVALLSVLHAAVEAFPAARAWMRASQTRLVQLVAWLSTLPQGGQAGAQRAASPTTIPASPAVLLVRVLARAAFVQDPDGVDAAGARLPLPTDARLHDSPATDCAAVVQHVDCVDWNVYELLRHPGVAASTAGPQLHPTITLPATHLHLLELSRSSPHLAVQAASAMVPVSPASAVVRSAAAGVLAAESHAGLSAAAVALHAAALAALQLAPLAWSQGAAERGESMLPLHRFLAPPMTAADGWCFARTAVAWAALSAGRSASTQRLVLALQDAVTGETHVPLTPWQCSEAVAAWCTTVESETEWDGLQNVLSATQPAFLRAACATALQAGGGRAHSTLLRMCSALAHALRRHRTAAASGLQTAAMSRRGVGWLEAVWAVLSVAQRACSAAAPSWTASLAVAVLSLARAVSLVRAGALTSGVSTTKLSRAVHAAWEPRHAAECADAFALVPLATCLSDIALERLAVLPPAAGLLRAVAFSPTDAVAWLPGAGELDAWVADQLQAWSRRHTAALQPPAWLEAGVALLCVASSALPISAVTGSCAAAVDLLSRPSFSSQPLTPVVGCIVRAAVAAAVGCSPALTVPPAAGASIRELVSRLFEDDAPTAAAILTHIRSMRLRESLDEQLLRAFMGALDTGASSALWRLPQWWCALADLVGTRPAAGGDGGRYGTAASRRMSALAQAACDAIASPSATAASVMHVLTVWLWWVAPAPAALHATTLDATGCSAVRRILDAAGQTLHEGAEAFGGALEPLSTAVAPALPAAPPSPEAPSSGGLALVPTSLSTIDMVPSTLTGGGAGDMESRWGGGSAAWLNASRAGDSVASRAVTWGLPASPPIPPVFAGAAPPAPSLSRLALACSRHLHLWQPAVAVDAISTGLDHLWLGGKPPVSLAPTSMHVDQPALAAAAVHDVSAAAAAAGMQLRKLAASVVVATVKHAAVLGTSVGEAFGRAWVATTAATPFPDALPPLPHTAEQAMTAWRLWAAVAATAFRIAPGAHSPLAAWVTGLAAGCTAALQLSPAVPVSVAQGALAALATAAQGICDAGGAAACVDWWQVWARAPLAAVSASEGGVAAMSAAAYARAGSPHRLWHAILDRCAQHALSDRLPLLAAAWLAVIAPACAVDSGCATAIVTAGSLLPVLVSCTKQLHLHASASHELAPLVHGLLQLGDACAPVLCTGSLRRETHHMWLSLCVAAVEGPGSDDRLRQHGASLLLRLARGAPAHAMWASHPTVLTTLAGGAVLADDPAASGVRPSVTGTLNALLHDCYVAVLAGSPRLRASLAATAHSVAGKSQVLAAPPAGRARAPAAAALFVTPAKPPPARGCTSSTKSAASGGSAPGSTASSTGGRRLRGDHGGLGTGTGTRGRAALAGLAATASGAGGVKLDGWLQTGLLGAQPAL